MSVNIFFGIISIWYHQRKKTKPTIYNSFLIFFGIMLMISIFLCLWSIYHFKKNMIFGLATSKSSPKLTPAALYSDKQQNLLYCFHPDQINDHQGKISIGDRKDGICLHLYGQVHRQPKRCRSAMLNPKGCAIWCVSGSLYRVSTLETTYNIEKCSIIEIRFTALSRPLHV